MTAFNVNGRAVNVTGDPDKPLLWVLREDLQLTGTKFGCGMALCGACTVHVDGSPVRSCVTPITAVEGRRGPTIEGLAAGGPRPPRHGAGGEQDAPPRADIPAG